jgi:hypothetical protein
VGAATERTPSISAEEAAAAMAKHVDTGEIEAVDADGSNIAASGGV